MALPQSKTSGQLRQLSDKALQAYFDEHARFCKQNPAKSKYAIQFGSRSIHAEDTAVLRQKFFDAVRAK